MPLILEDVSFTYGAGRPYAVPALVAVTVTVGPGELVLVVGETGSGKSTLMRVAAGLLGPQSGSVTLEGEDLTLQSARGKVGLVFQDAESQLFADTLLDDVAFGPRNLGAPAASARERAVRALEEVGLPADAYAERSPFSLSGGEARRAAIAGVLAMDPSYLLADEPTAGLDAGGRAAVKRLLLGIRERAGVVVVSHVAEEFLGEADRLVVLSEGRVAWSGAASEAIADPRMFSAHDLRAPDVLEVQLRAAAVGRRIAEFTLDPIRAAEQLTGGGA